MAKILFLPYAPQYGTLYGLLDLAQFFSKCGDEIFFGGEGKFSRVVKAEGYEFFHLPELTFDHYRKFVDNGNLGMHTYKSAKEFVQAELLLYERLKPDLIITQARLTVPVSALIAKIPYISVTVPVLTEHFEWPKKIPESMSNIASLANIPLLGPFIAANISNYLKFMSRQWIRPYNKILQDYGHNPFKNLYELYKGDMLTLVPENEYLFPMKPGYKEERFIYSGPLLHYNHLNTPKWYNETKELDGNFIYLSMGSSSLTLYPLLLKKLARIYGDKPNIYIITNTTYIISAKQKRPQLPSNFFITNMASAEVMLSLADITICHGGKGTIYHSILNGVPLLGIPQQAEQEMNLIRIKELGLGDYLLSKEFLEISDADLKNRIDYVLYNKEIQKNVLNFSSKIRNCMGDLDDIVRKIHIKINQ